jgi:hypothetical protein
MLIRLRHPKRFRRDKSSLAALEFAIVLPIMILLLAGVYDFSEAAIIRAEVYNAADTMAASASALAVQQDGSTALTYQQVQLVESSIWALMPSLRNGIAQNSGNPKSITISSVFYFPQLGSPCVFGQTASCSYIADIAWSEAYTGGTTGATFQNNLPTTGCSTVYTSASQSQVSATTNLSGTNNLEFFRTLGISTSTATFTDTGTQQNEAGVAPILAVTIQYTYSPLFTFYILRPFNFWVNAYWPVRSVKNVAARTVNVGAGNVTIQPLASQFTSINANSLTAAGVNKNYYCVNGGAAGATS